MRVMIFIEGTTFYTKPLLFLFTKYGYKPIGSAIQIVNSLYEKGDEIYLCSYVRKKRHGFIKSIIDFYGMKYTEILCRDKNQKYSELVEQIKPDILIEDDCKSIGGLKNCCITDVKDEIKTNIRSIIVPDEKNKAIVKSAEQKIDRAVQNIKKGKAPKEGIGFFYHLAGLLGQRVFFYLIGLGCQKPILNL